MLLNVKKCQFHLWAISITHTHFCFSFNIPYNLSVVTVLHGIYHPAKSPGHTASSHLPPNISWSFFFLYYVYSLHIYRIFGPFSHTMCSNDTHFGVFYQTLEVPEARNYLNEAWKISPLMAGKAIDRLEDLQFLGGKKGKNSFGWNISYFSCFSIYFRTINNTCILFIKVDWRWRYLQDNIKAIVQFTLMHLIYLLFLFSHHSLMPYVNGQCEKVACHEYSQARSDHPLYDHKFLLYFRG